MSFNNFPNNNNMNRGRGGGFRRNNNNNFNNNVGGGNNFNNNNNRRNNYGNNNNNYNNNNRMHNNNNKRLNNYPNQRPKRTKAMDQPIKCQVCSSTDAKYKCPNCLIRYCRLECYKKHKETPCEKKIEPITNRSKINSIENNNDQKIYANFMEFQGLSNEQIEKLDKNEKLTKSIEENKVINDLLQSLLVGNKSTFNMCMEIEQLEKSNVNFAEYVQEILHTIGVRDLNGDCLL
eukprot:TRINITY_DN4352_c0_g1_i1.p1 TRINITY_DN4352_c0_g1~~TRINITY_DN4352_c0_g1_i1.p1  ORF type:complete len:234 (-),score=84.56 TRINITY_DN4352_c0_g1_i1:22-723(-)